jgi:hypothetical protein
MEKTVDLIISSAKLPYSIIIVGIGNAEFDNMNILDGDAGKNLFFFQIIF